MSVAAGRVSGQVAEYPLKATFLMKFADFVTWPKESFSDAQSPIVIGVLGTDPFGEILAEVVKDVKVGNRKLVVERYNRVGDIKNCHILFISKSEDGKRPNTFADLKGRHILTVGEDGVFARTGGIIGIEIVKDRAPRLIINMENADSEKLKIDPRLLNLPGVELIENKKGK